MPLRQPYQPGDKISERPVTEFTDEELRVTDIDGEEISTDKLKLIKILNLHKPCVREAYMYGLGGFLCTYLATFGLTGRNRLAIYGGLAIGYVASMSAYGLCFTKWAKNEIAVDEVKSVSRRFREKRLKDDEVSTFRDKNPPKGTVLPSSPTSQVT